MQGRQASQVARVTVADTPAGFYLVHLAYGATLDAFESSIVLGPGEFAALTRDRDLRPHLQSVDQP